jgi:hypothetical protein
MHRSGLGGFIIDCEGEDLAAAAAFWSRALGLDTMVSTDPADAGYVLLRTGSKDPHIEVQKVLHPSGVHLDIEADDVEAEVRRLEGLGALRVRNVRDWCVMQAPTGQRFCVVPARKEGFAERSREWR